MKISVHFTLFIALLVCGFNSAHGLDATLLDDTCKSSAVADPYEIGARLSESTYSHAGKCVDADLFRPAKIIKETGESIVFSNYFHDGEYYTFELKKSHPIEHLFYQILRFDVIQGITAGHVQFRVKFKTPVVIVSQTDTSKKVEVNDIIVSFEAARPKGVKYNFALGTMDSYVLVGRIMSGQAKLKEEYASTQQYEIKLPNKTDSMDLLITAIKQSDKDQYKRYYDTLWPNCATQIFDLMDSLPSMATKKMERFLTVLSNDPVAGPALQGLEKRGVLIGEYATMRDELETGATRPVVSENTPATTQYLANISGYPYSIVVVVPNHSSDVEKVLVEKLTKELRLCAPSAIQGIGSAMMLGRDQAIDIIKAALGSVVTNLLNKLPEIEKTLPNGKAIQVGIYFTPWNTKLGTKLEPLEQSGVLIRLPFNAYKAKQKDAFWAITSGQRKVLREPNLDLLPFNLLGTLIHINLEKGNSEVTFQVNGRLSSITKEVDVKNPQIELSQFVIPKADDVWDQTTAIISISQKISETIPRMNIEFGAEGGLKGSLKRRQLGQYQVFKTNKCDEQAKFVPRFKGVLGANPLGNALVDMILKNNDIALKIFKADFDFENFKIKDIDVRVGTWPVNCQDVDSVDQQVKNEANGMIENMLSKSNGGDDSLSSSILNYIFPGK